MSDEWCAYLDFLPEECLDVEALRAWTDRFEDEDQARMYPSEGDLMRSLAAFVSEYPKEDLRVRVYGPHWERDQSVYRSREEILAATKDYL